MQCRFGRKSLTVSSFLRPGWHCCKAFFLVLSMVEGWGTPETLDLAWPYTQIDVPHACSHKFLYFYRINTCGITYYNLEKMTKDHLLIPLLKRIDQTISESHLTTYYNSRIAEIYTHSLTDKTATLRMVIATEAFGMWHYSEDNEAYIKRNEDVYFYWGTCYAIHDFICTFYHMHVWGCICCDLCAQNCQCGNCNNNIMSERYVYWDCKINVLARNLQSPTCFLAQNFATMSLAFFAEECTPDGDP